MTPHSAWILRKATNFRSSKRRDESLGPNRDARGLDLARDDDEAGVRGRGGDYGFVLVIQEDAVWAARDELGAMRQRGHGEIRLQSDLRHQRVDEWLSAV